MARQATIVSFDDAKSKSRRGRAAGSERQSREERFERRGFSMQSDRRSSAIRSERGKSSTRFGRRDEAARSERVELEERSGRRGTAARSRREELEERSDRRGADARSERRDASKRSERRRERTKARAEKMYSRQFDTAASDVPAEGAPRAALYEAKMGASHRKSARMQRSSTASSPSAKRNLAGWFSSIPVSSKSLKIGTAVLCVFLIAIFLYVPAQQYYKAQREHDRVVAEYSAIENRNNALDEQNDVLVSDSGMEDAVRKKFGYVKQGEQVATVTGLSDRATDTSRDSENIEASVLSGSVRPSEEWYTPLLDAFFGVG